MAKISKTFTLLFNNRSNLWRIFHQLCRSEDVLDAMEQVQDCLTALINFASSKSRDANPSFSTDSFIARTLMIFHDYKFRWGYTLDYFPMCSDDISVTSAGIHAIFNID